MKRVTTQPAPDDLTLKGHFLLMFAAFEAMLSELMLVYLMESPDRALKDKSLTIDTSDLLGSASTAAIISELVEKRVQNVMYERLPTTLEKFYAILTITPLAETEHPALLDLLIEMKETRNLLVHNNLVVNSTYIDRAGTAARRPVSKKLPMNVQYVEACGNTLCIVVAHVESEIRRRFGNLTRVQVLRDLWNHIFDTPVMPFDQFWYIDTQRDTVGGFKKKRGLIRKISGTEWRFYQIWLAHAAGGVEIKNFNMKLFDSENTQKLLWFLERLKTLELSGCGSY